MEFYVHGLHHLPRCDTRCCRADDAAGSGASFQKERSSLEKFGFPTPANVPTELEEAISLWMQPDVRARQGQLLDGLIATHPTQTMMSSKWLLTAS